MPRVDEHHTDGDAQTFRLQIRPRRPRARAFYSERNALSKTVIVAVLLGPQIFTSAATTDHLLGCLIRWPMNCCLEAHH
jgi:hypothetical protein